MAKYAYRGRPPVSLTADELRRVLNATGDRMRNFRDHLIISLAVGSGMREHEIAALDVGDVVPLSDERSAKVGIRSRVELRVWKGHQRAKPGTTQTVMLTDETRRKLGTYVHRLRAADGSLELTQPLFASRNGDRIATRTMRDLWRKWQVAAGFERVLPFHALRHTFVTKVYDASKDPILACRLARHSSVETTMIYTHGSDEAMAAVMRRMP